MFNEEKRNSAWKKCYGTDSYPLVKWNEAKVIVSLEADFLGNDSNKVENSRLFAEGRNVEEAKKFNRLYVVEGNMSLTGMNADYRLKLRADAQYEFAMSLLKEVARRIGILVPVNLSAFSLDTIATNYSLDRDKLKFLFSGFKLTAEIIIFFNSS